jgi:LacI family transcriptional regulator
MSMKRSEITTSMPKRPTIADVAQACGLSRATVARALSGKGYVENEKRLLVQKTARKIGYRTSALARALRTQRSASVGVLIADITNPIFPQIVKGIDDVLSAKGHTILLRNTDESPQKQIALASSLIDRHVDGLILVSQSLETPAIRDLLAGGPPCVFVNRRPFETADYVGPDNIQAIDLLVDHLAGIGHTKIGYITGTESSSTSRERLSQFSVALQRRGLAVRPEWVFPGDYTIECGREAVRKMSLLSDRPTAIMAANDFSALGMIEEAQSRGLSVPRDLSVTGFDDVLSFSDQLPHSLSMHGLTTISQPKREIGMAAAAMLLERLTGGRETTLQPVILPVDIKVRDTTAPPPTGQEKPHRTRRKRAAR